VRKKNWNGGGIEVDRTERRNDENPKGRPNREMKEEKCNWNLERRDWKKE
jgi:hypothetical protein